MNLAIPQSDINIFKNDRPFNESSTVRVPATCGELMQGHLDGQDFLINSPISRFARFKVDVVSNSKVVVKGKGNFGKVNRAVTETLSLLGIPEKGASIEVLESIPRGKGLASSTAEMTAAISATSFAVSGTYWDERRFPHTLLEIDRSTDAVYCHGITMCDYLTGRVIEQFSKIPSLEFIVVDEGCDVETADFDREKARANAIDHRERLQSALALMIYGLNQQIPSLIAKAATESALINQKILEKQGLQELLEGTRAWGSLGVNSAHTGSVLGVLFDPLSCDGEKLYERVQSLVGKDKVIGRYELISGGIY